MERIAKVIARAGICSRRQAEILITASQVKVNGAVITNLAHKVSDIDIVEVNGKPLEKVGKPRLWIFHKPRGVITTNRDPQGRKTVFDLLPKEMPRVIAIGRLDYNSEGLLLFTNDGSIARSLELPKTAIVREYRVRVYGRLPPNLLSTVAEGVVIEGIRYAGIEVIPGPGKGSTNTWFRVKLKEGKNREIRKIFSHFGLEVNRLIRIAYGSFTLDGLQLGQIKEINDHKVRMLINLL